MKDNFDKCFEMLLKHEGAFVNRPEDPDGATNLCVTKRVMHVFFDELLLLIGHEYSNSRCYLYEHLCLII